MMIPSWGLPGTGSRRTRLLALLAVRDGMRHLPGFLRNVAPQVNGIIALDDGSSDGTPELLARHGGVIELLRRPPNRPTWDEVANHRSLIAAALRHRAEWVVCIDADERLEREFRARAERVIARGRLLGLSAYAVRLRELWDDPGQFRVDGIWGRKMIARLFRAREDHEFDPSALHGSKAPMQLATADASQARTSPSTTSACCAPRTARLVGVATSSRIPNAGGSGSATST